MFADNVNANKIASQGFIWQVGTTLELLQVFVWIYIANPLISHMILLRKLRSLDEND